MNGKTQKTEQVFEVRNLRGFVNMYLNENRIGRDSNYVMTFGKYRGRNIQSVPYSYFRWACTELNYKPEENNGRGSRSGWENSSGRRPSEPTEQKQSTTPRARADTDSSTITDSDRKKLLNFFIKED